MDFDRFARPASEFPGDNIGDAQSIRHDRQRRADAECGRKEATIDHEEVRLTEHSAISVEHGVGRIIAKAKRATLVGDVLLGRKTPRKTEKRTGVLKNFSHEPTLSAAAVEIVWIERMTQNNLTSTVQRNSVGRAR